MYMQDNKFDILSIRRNFEIWCSTAPPLLRRPDLTSRKLPSKFCTMTHLSFPGTGCVQSRHYGGVQRFFPIAAQVGWL